MGAHDYTVTYSFYEKDKVKSAWARLCEEDAYDSGSGAYAGNATTMGGAIQFYDKAFDSEAEAYRWVMDNHRKWGSPYACSFYLPKETSVAKQKRIDKAKAKLREEEKKKVEFVNAEIDAFTQRSSQLVGCSCCGSKLNRKLLNNARFMSRGSQSVYSTGSHYTSYGRLPKCPLCAESLLSKTVNSKLERLDKRIERAKALLEEAQKPSPSKEIGWVVGGWAAS